MRRAQVVDSPGWLKYIGDGPAAGVRARSSAVEQPDRLVIPVITQD